MTSGFTTSKGWLLAILISLSPALMAGEVSVAVAANFTDTTRTLASHFEQETGHTVSASFGSTGKLYAQIKNGAPFDVFMAADIRRPERIEQEGDGVASSRFTYARGKLALWSPKPEAFDSAPHYLTEQTFARLAIANPKTAPYGLAAQQALEQMNLWSSLQPKLVRGDSIAQTFQFVASGNAQAGFVALSQVKAWPEEKGTLWPVPQNYYQPIDQQAILLNRASNNDAAKAWLAFLKSPAALSIIQDYGYDTVE
ncbi:molybdate ABC transporter substrate-binding protein [Marinobacter daepoensis]|uniref:molybdate ABC transporter substrate-binding protein n=1 Tax=Marinobacter daepoensis TaxID=262077 RepID=UPI001C95CA6E|nr:molybdate ABC transporter substrate-binding protein [Marinobacter daepoensis]MBY6033821.1 molybdate ABC transporter substrate-binding protein [Marinobacter daepoensis]